MMSVRLLRVRGLSRKSVTGTISLGGQRFPCALGRGGRLVRKREGDGGTPVGRFRLIGVLYRSDRRSRPRTALPVRSIRSADGWCDAVGDRNYNRAVSLPYPSSAEHMFREDMLYDLVVILDHNSRPRKRGLGSAIFLHVARKGLLPTEGCVALDARQLETLLARLGRGAMIDIA